MPGLDEDGGQVFVVGQHFINWAKSTAHIFLWEVSKPLIYMMLSDYHIKKDYDGCTWDQENARFILEGLSRKLHSILIKQKHSFHWNKSPWHLLNPSSCYLNIFFILLTLWFAHSFHRMHFLFFLLFCEMSTNLLKSFFNAFSNESNNPHRSRKFFGVLHGFSLSL